ncbi:6184_t:CDS:10 [Paraglomus occultum]|uniref:6184_t:CDS:1 n=1 Tax=Paraglomus occultum TaxID=144539 RepID=A0A9N8WQ73_9GLOM|nr:6184_t:CDS:10 [Paraglomus occultum]
MSSDARKIAARAPVTINHSWLDCITEYAESHPTARLHPSIEIIRAFINDIEATWEKQCEYLKKIEKSLPSIKRQSKSSGHRSDQLHVDLTPEHKEQLVIVENVISKIYFTTTETLIKRHCIPILDACYRIVLDSDSRSHLTFAQQYDKYITHTQYTDHCLWQKAFSIYLTLDFSIGFDTVRSAIWETIHFLTNCLTTSVEQVQNINARNTKDSIRDSASSSMELALLMDDVQYVIKTLLALLSKFEENIRPSFEVLERHVEEDGGDDDDKDNHCNKLPNIKGILTLTRNLMNACLEICANDIYIKDLSQLAGMTFAACFQLTGTASFISTQIFLTFFIHNRSADTTASLLVTRLQVNMPECLQSDSGWTNDNTPMLFICRGLLSNVGYDVLTAHLVNAANTDVRVLKTDVENHVPASLYHLLFISVAYFCEAQISPQVKLIAFETMGLWLTETQSILKCQENTNKKITIKPNAAKKGARTLNTSSNPVHACFVTLTAETIESLLTPTIISVLISYVYNYWDDPIDAIQHKVRFIFHSLLNVLQLKAALCSTVSEHALFLQHLMKQLLEFDKYRKVKYSLMSMLIPRIGADVVLGMKKDVICDCIEVMDNLVIASKACEAVKVLLDAKMKEVTDQRNAGNENTTAGGWIDLWLEPVCRALSSDNAKRRKNIDNLLLPYLLKATPEAFWTLISVFQSDSNKSFVTKDEYRLHALITTIKVGRSLDLIDGESLVSGFPANKENNRLIHTQFLYDSMYHPDKMLRVDALGLICESHKRTSSINSIEISLLKEFISLNLNSTLPEFRQRLLAHFTKLFSRLHGNLYGQWREYLGKKKAYGDVEAVIKIKRRVDEIEHFLRWLIHLLVQQLYPGASYQRVSTSLKLLHLLIKHFGIDSTPPPAGYTVKHGKLPEFPFRLPFATPQLSLTLFDLLMNSYVPNRQEAYDVLRIFPAPLPGIESKEKAQNVLDWAFTKLKSGRAAESDGGAMVFRIVFVKYVVELGFELEVDNDMSGVETVEMTGVPSVDFTNKLLNFLHSQITFASSNLLLASRKHPIQGTLLALQYIFQELSYSSPIIKSHISHWRQIHKFTLKLIRDICDVVIDVLSAAAPEGNILMEDDEIDIDVRVVTDEDEDCQDDGQEDSPKHQVLLSYCWRAVKEASSLLGIILSRTPTTMNGISDEFSIITYEDFISSGDLIRNLLTSIRHRGAFSSIYPGYAALCSRLLNSGGKSLIDMARGWVEADIKTIHSNKVSITRRSGGLPLCILAVVSNEPSNHRVILPWTIKTLLSIATMPHYPTSDEALDLPQVHAFNSLRTIFMDARLATEVLTFVADGIMLSIRGFASHSWAIRNCSVMLFSTLVQRVFGTKKVKDEQHSINKLTGREFFSRFPKLHPFLMNELRIAVEQLVKDDKETSQIHPGLYPVLTLLSRLYPSLMESAHSVLSLSTFVPLVIECCKSRIQKTREMAARALTPLISSDHLLQTCSDILYACNLSNQNALHGRLAQIRQLFRGHLKTGVASYETAKLFLTEIPRVFVDKLDIATRVNECAVTRHLFLEIIYEFVFDDSWITFGIIEHHRKEYITLMNEKSSNLRSIVFDLCRSEISSDNGSSISYHLVRETMAKIIVNYILSHETFTRDNWNTIVELLADKDYEVRGCVLSQLIQKIKMVNQFNYTILQKKLVRMICDGEPSMDCLQRAVELLTLLDPEQPIPSASCESDVGIQDFWRTIVESYMERMNSLLVTESMLPLLGAVLSQTWMQESSMEVKSQYFTKWVEYANKYSQADMNLRLRESTMQSLHFFSRFLFKDRKTYAERITPHVMILYEIIIRLVQDDDINIRESAATLISKSMELKVPVDYEKAREMCYEYLTKQYSRSLYFYASFLKILTAEQKPDNILANAMSPQRTLFAVENPNIFKEDLIDVQLSFRCLCDATADADMLQIPDVICNDIPLFAIEQLKGAISILKNANNQGPLGLTSRSDVFLVTYRTILMVILGLRMANKKRNEIESGYNNIIELVQQNTHMLHPLLYELLVNSVYKDKYGNVPLFLTSSVTQSSIQTDTKI